MMTFDELLELHLPKDGKRPGRRLKMLIILALNADGITLNEMVGALGEEGRKAHAATVTMLHHMRQKDLVAYEPSAEPHDGSGRPAGVYSLGTTGMAAIRAVVGDLDIELLRPQADTRDGAMRDDKPTVLKSRACIGQAPRNIPSSVFALGMLAA